MHMQVPGPFEYERATSVDHAIGLLDRLGDGAMLVAGGHSLLPMMKLRIANPEYLVDINDLVPELGYIVVDPTLVRIGAMTRHREALASEAPSLGSAAPCVNRCQRVDSTRAHASTLAHDQQEDDLLAAPHDRDRPDGGAADDGRAGDPRARPGTVKR